ncbi:MAG TPA: efflux transporter outer membrane subunit, partial [Gammaproteobacteria bacterium]|nr:efflux transporter outer membrane subunit [Gammaproteobacteria bacterium]
LQQYLETDEARRSAQIALVAEVVTQYFSLREAEEQLALARDTLANVQESYRLNAIEFDVGEINELDLRTADGQVQSARVNVLTYERQTAQAYDQLIELVGVPELPADLPEATPFDQGPSLLADVPAGLPADLVERRPDILEAEHALLAANADIGVARAAFFPSISLTGSVGRSSTELSGLVGSTGARVWSFAPQLSLPLFSAGANRANLDAARVAKDIAVANYERTIQGAFREVADALVAVSTYGDEIDTQRAAIDAQARRFALADVRYRQGQDSYLTVLSAQQDLYSAQQARLRAQFNRLSSQISLYRALGGGWQ